MTDIFDPVWAVIVAEDRVTDHLAYDGEAFYPDFYVFEASASGGAAHGDGGASAVAPSRTALLEFAPEGSAAGSSPARGHRRPDLLDGSSTTTPGCAGPPNSCTTHADGSVRHCAGVSCPFCDREAA